MKRIVAIILCLFLLTSCGTSDNSPVTEDKPTAAQQQTKTQDTPTSIQQPQEEKAPADATETSKPVFTEEASSTSPVKSDPPEEAPASVETSPPEKTPDVLTVSLDIIGLDGNIIFSGSAEYYEGITVFDVLIESAKGENIPVVYSGSKSSAYITSIGGLAEKQHGGMSGWIYTVNDESVMKPSAKCILNPGDHVEWKYITEF